jgi:hypothetical protein
MRSRKEPAAGLEEALGLETIPNSNNDGDNEELTNKDWTKLSINN